ncbi:MAG: hypothetical protein U9N09_07810 [Euryarchaeota archaeon]|nr:hypothetical protein [Euryarchaeota archaeon]
MKRHQRKECDDPCDDEDTLVHDPEFQSEEPEVGEYDNGGADPVSPDDLLKQGYWGYTA